MTFPDVKEELHQLLDETRREIYGKQCTMSGVTYVRFLRRRDALVFACKVVDTVANLHGLFCSGGVHLRAPFRSSCASCECGHPMNEHVVTVGACLVPGCPCVTWEEP